MACVICHKIYSPSDDSQVDCNERPHLCTTCGLSFTLKIQLKRHMILHADGAPYTCKYCVKDSENSGKTYNLRLGNKSEYTCEECHKSFSNKRMLLRHSIQHSYESEDGFEERIKITIKKRPRRISKHLHIKSSDREPLKLSLKRNLFYTKSRTKKLICEDCNKGFAYQACLDKHIKMGKCIIYKPSPTHVNDESIEPLESKSVPCDISDSSKKHICSVCGKTFARKSSLDGHELSHILNKETSEDERYFSENEDNSQPKKARIATFKFQKSYTCDQCNFVCFSKQTLNKHTTNHKAKDLEACETDKNVQEKEINLDSSTKKSSNKLKSFKDLEKEVCVSYKCEKCDKKFKNETKLIKHNCLHNKNDKSVKKTFDCKKCGEVFDLKKDFKHHRLSHIESNTDASSVNKEVFSKHRIKRNKNYACEVCGRRFAGEICFRKHLLKHEEDVNNVETGTLSFSTSHMKKLRPPKELKCEYCEEDFTGKRAAYIKHIHAHTPEVCGICDKRFVDRQSLREHCKIHVGTEEGKMFMQCSQKALDAKNGLLAPEPKVEYIYLVLR